MSLLMPTTTESGQTSTPIAIAVQTAPTTTGNATAAPVPPRAKRSKIPISLCPLTVPEQHYLADVIPRSFAISTFDTQERHYLPAPCLQRHSATQSGGGLVTKTAVERELRRAPQHSSYPLDTIVEWIVGDASKVFAITVQCHMDPEFFLASMINFYNVYFDDEALPIADPRATDPRAPRPSRSEAFPSHIWADQRHDEFFQFQWTCLAPVFVAEQYEYDLRSQYILPFQKALDTDPRSGSFSSVFKVTVHKDHQKRHSSTEVAIKQITVQKSTGHHQTEKAWEIEARALSAINLLEHRHIMKSIAAIRRGDSRYFMFPWAEESLRDYWNATPKQSPDPHLILEALDQLRGIADALDQLHNFRGGPSLDNETYREVKIVVDPGTTDDSAPRMDDDEDVNDYRNPMSQESIRHGDLKPENILRFLDGRSRLGTLKLGDMGLAKRHVAATEKRHGTSMRYGTRRYEGPETTIPKQGRSRLYDLWSMGCITFEFIIWLLYGNEALVDFYDQAEKESAPADFQYYKMRGSGGESRSTVHPTVIRWMDHMQKYDPECQQSSTSALKDLLQIVREKLLVVDLPPTRGSALASGGGGRGIPLPGFVGGKVSYRATAAEFRKALDAIKRKEKNANYVYTGQDRSAVNLPFAPAYGNSLHPSIPHHTNTSLRVDSKIGPVASGVLSRKIEADYSLPPLEAWEFEVDNIFAEKAISHLDVDNSARLSATRNQLCSRCATLNFWSSGFAIEYDVDDLAQSAKACDLCEMLHNASSGIDPLYSEKIRFERNQSVITITGNSFPVLSIFRSLELFTPLAIQIGSPKLPDLEDSSSNAFFDMAKEWLRDCNDNHPGCRVQLAHTSPTRLIDVGTLANPRLRLVETKHEVVHDPRYIALSHPWGDTEAYEAFTTIRNDPSPKSRDLARFKISIPYADLPKTFKHAVDCTRKLNIPYLWIDSICIIQGPDGDFRDEAKKMEDVYSGAYCVIAASRAGDQRDGFLGARPQRKYVTFNHSKSFYVCETIDHFNDDVIAGSLNQRGWVLQERALARRTMFFTKNQTYFECGNGVRCETLTRMHNNMADFLGDPSFPDKAMRVKSRALKIEYFQGLYKQYSRLAFTRYVDRPIAIAGLEKRLQRAFGTRGRYGVFDDGNKPDNGLFHRSLLWQREQDGHPLEAIEFPEERKMHVPSWSWMAYKGGIDYTDPPYQSATWETRELIPPWTRGQYADPDTVDEDVALKAVARDFSLAGRKQDEVKVAYDTEKSSEGKKVQCVIVARSVEGSDSEKRFYVLLVIPTGEETEEGVKKYKRVGAGFMLGKYIVLDRPGVEVRIF